MLLSDTSCCCSANVIVPARKSSSKQHSIARLGTAWQTTARLGTARHSTAQHSMAGHSTAQHGTARLGTAWQTTAQAMHMQASMRPCYSRHLMPLIDLQAAHYAGHWTAFGSSRGICGAVGIPSPPVGPQLWPGYSCHPQDSLWTSNVASAAVPAHDWSDVAASVAGRPFSLAVVRQHCCCAMMLERFYWQLSDNTAAVPRCQLLYADCQPTLL